MQLTFVGIYNMNTTLVALACTIATAFLISFIYMIVLKIRNRRELAADTRLTEEEKSIVRMCRRRKYYRALQLMFSLLAARYIMYFITGG